MSPPSHLGAGALAATERVGRTFGAVRAVEDVSLAVRGGEVVGLLGANGAGKTTVIRMLLGLLAPTSGSVRLFGETPSRRTRTRLGYVPQSLGLYADLTVEENIRFSASAFGVSASSLELPASLAGVRDQLAGGIGLGRQRQLAFVCALGHAPELLVLDEPTSGVDPLARARLWERIREQAEQGSGVLITTHYLEEAHQCDRLLIMASGRVVASGTLAEVIDGATAVRVRCATWAPAFDALSETGLPITLSGREIRVAGASVAQVRTALGEAGIDAALEQAPATLEETMTLIGSRPVPANAGGGTRSPKV